MVGSGLPASIHRRTSLRAPERGSGGSEVHRGRRPEDRARIVVTVIDDRALFGESLATAVNAQAGDIVMTHWRVGQALADPAAALRDADVVLVCIGRTGLSKGATNHLLKALLGTDPHPPIAVLSDTVSPGMVRTGMGMGLDGIIASTVPLRSVIDALRRIHSGATVLPNMH